MKKLFTFLAVIVFSFALSSCGGQKTEDTGDASGQVAEEAQQDEVAEEDTGVFASIQDAISKSIPLKCTYTDEDGLTMDIYIKGNMMRADSIKKTASDLAVSEIVRDNKLYFWSEGSNQGMLIDFSKMQPAESDMTMGETSVDSADDIFAEVDKQRQNCSMTVVSDSMFELPANVTFAEF